MNLSSNVIALLSEIVTVSTIVTSFNHSVFVKRNSLSDIGFNLLSNTVTSLHIIVTSLRQHC